MGVVVDPSEPYGERRKGTQIPEPPNPPKKEKKPYYKEKKGKYYYYYPERKTETPTEKYLPKREEPISPKTAAILTTIQQYKMIQEMAREKRRIESSRLYLVPESFFTEGGKGYRHMKGTEVQQLIGEQYMPLFKSQVEFKRELKKWHPETKIYMTDAGIKVKFPYAGAERYAELKKEYEEAHPLKKLSLMFTPEDPFLIPSTITEWTQGKQKALDRKIMAIARIKEIKTPFSVEYAMFMLESPGGQLGLGVAGGAVFGKVMPLAVGYATARYGLLGGRTVTGAGLIVGGALIGKEAYEIKKELDVGEIGTATARAARMGLMLTGAYAGYKATSPGMYERGQQVYFTRKGISEELIGVRKGILERYSTRYKDWRSAGTPTERGEITIQRLYQYRPGELTFMAKDEAGLGAYLRYDQLQIGKLRGGIIGEHETIPLGKAAGMRTIEYRSPIKGGLFKRIYVYKQYGIQLLEEKTLAEIMGGGGITQQAQLVQPIQIGELGGVEAPLFTHKVTPTTIVFTIPKTTTVQQKAQALKPEFEVKPLQRVTELVRITEPTISVQAPVFIRTTAKQTEKALMQRMTQEYEQIQKQIQKQTYVTEYPYFYKTKAIYPKFALEFKSKGFKGGGAGVGRIPTYDVFLFREHLIKFPTVKEALTL